MTTATLRGIAAGVAAGSLLLALVSPLSASADNKPITPPPSNGSVVFVDPALVGTTIDRTAIPDTTPIVSPELQAQLEEHGLTGPVVTAQKGANGLGTFYADEYGWVLDLGPNSGDGAVSTEAFGYGGCTGFFTTPRKVSNYLQWGGQSSCWASDGHYYLHKVSAALYDTCIGPLCAILTYRATVTSPTSSQFLNIATAYGTRTCVNSNGRTYEQKVNVTVRSVAYGPFWERDVVVNNCSVAP